MRTPNPRVALPVLFAVAGGAAVGYFVTAASCAPGSCLPAAIGMAVVVGLVAAIGVGTVVILAVRSFAEWREHTEREVLVMEEPAGPTVTPSVGEDGPGYPSPTGPVPSPMTRPKTRAGAADTPSVTGADAGDTSPFGGGNLEEQP